MELYIEGTLEVTAEDVSMAGDDLTQAAQDLLGHTGFVVIEARSDDPISEVA